MTPEPMPHTGRAYFPGPAGARAYADPAAVLEAHTIRDVVPVIEAVARHVDAGRHAAGFVAYEAGPAFDPALDAHPPLDALPLAWFGLYDAPGAAVPKPGAYTVGAWRPALSEAAYHKALARIRAYIAAGDTYQVNYTFPLEAAFEGDATAWFTDLCRAQRAGYCALIDLGRFCVLSASPELFFRRAGNRIETRPMKGTRPRGLWCAADDALARELAQSPKDRAENVMIVDLVRNDLGRISPPGAVAAAQLFAVERYPTVWQMTSTVAAHTDAPLPALFRALFPCGSVTGAPKVRTTQIIRELEPVPRGVYCGAVGWCAPGGDACFNVAIRTVLLDRVRGTARYGVGGGVTWDSDPAAEFAECQTKAAVLTTRRPDFELLEAVLYDNGYFLFEQHLKRLAASAAYFDFEIDLAQLRDALECYARQHLVQAAPAKVRLAVDERGRYSLSHTDGAPCPEVRAGLAREPVDATSVWLYHKTTCRDAYAQAAASRPDCQDVILYNREGFLTESTRANLVLDIDGACFTPPVEAGLLPGVFRAHLLETGQIREAPLTRADLGRAGRVWLVNSVRRWMRVSCVA